MCYASRRGKYLVLALVLLLLAASLPAEEVTYYPDEFDLAELRTWNEPMSGSLFFGMSIIGEVRQIMLDHGDDERAFLVWLDAFREMGTWPLLQQKYSYGQGSKTVAEYVLEVVVLSMSERNRALWFSLTKRRR